MSAGVGCFTHRRIGVHRAQRVGGRSHVAGARDLSVEGFEVVLHPGRFSESLQRLDGGVHGLDFLFTGRGQALSGIEFIDCP